MFILSVIWLGNSKERLVCGQLLSWRTVATVRLTSLSFKWPWIRLRIVVLGAIQLSVKKRTWVPFVTCHCNLFWQIFHPFIRCFYKIEVLWKGCLGLVMYLEIKKEAQGVWGWWNSLQALPASKASLLFLSLWMASPSCSFGIVTIFQLIKWSHLFW